MKKIILSYIFVNLLLAFSIFNIPAIVNAFKERSYNEEVDRVNSIRDSIRYSIEVDSLNKSRVRSMRPTIALSFNENLHLTQIDFLDNDTDVIASLDSTDIPYFSMDLSRTNSKEIESAIRNFPYPRVPDDIRLKTSLIPYAASSIDSIDSDGILSYSISSSDEYYDVLGSIYKDVLYIDNDTICAITLNDVGTINSIFLSDNNSIIAEYPLWIELPGENEEIEIEEYRQFGSHRRKVKRKVNVSIPKKEITSDPVALAEHECIGYRWGGIQYASDNKYNLSHRKKAHDLLLSNECIKRRFSNKRIKVHAHSINYIFEGTKKGFNDVKDPIKSVWIPSGISKSIIVSSCLVLLFFIVFTLLIAAAYYINYYMGGDKTHQLDNKYKLGYYSRRTNKAIDVICSVLVKLNGNMSSWYKWGLLTPVCICIMPFCGMVGALINLLFGDESLIDRLWTSLILFLAGMLAEGIGLGFIYLFGFYGYTITGLIIAFLITPLLSYLTNIALIHAFKLRYKSLERIFPNAGNSIGYIDTDFTFSNDEYDLRDILVVAFTTKKTFKKTEELYQSLFEQLKCRLEEYPKEVGKILDTLPPAKIKTIIEDRPTQKDKYAAILDYLKSNLSWNLDLSFKIIDIPNELKRQETLRVVDKHLLRDYPNGYQLWKVLTREKLSYKKMQDVHDLAVQYENEISSGRLSTYALYFLKHGFTLTTIKGTEDAKSSWKTDLDILKNASEANRLITDECTGIGTILGGSSAIRALDIDNLDRDICRDIDAQLNGEPEEGHLQRLLSSLLTQLELPADYPWIVISGSHHGIHILFKCEDGGLLSGKSYSFSSDTLFERLELRWNNCHLVLPPSLHFSESLSEGHNRYQFIKKSLPQIPLTSISVNALNSAIMRFCGLRQMSGQYSCNTTKLPLRFVRYGFQYSLTESGGFVSEHIGDTELVNWLQKCDDSQSQNTLGVLYCIGNNVATDINIAVQYFKKANNDDAKYNLVMLMSSGCIVCNQSEVLSILDEIKDKDDSLETIVRDNLEKRFKEEGFNFEQRQAINLNNGRHLVLAPPGCGKTRVLGARVVKAIGNGVSLKDMLCLTFTNRASREMKDEISKGVSMENAEELFVGNIHHFCSKILREYKVIDQRTTIIDDEEKDVILSDIYRRLFGAAIPETDVYYYYQHWAYQIEHNHPVNLIIHPEMSEHNYDHRFRRIAKEYVSYKNKYSLIDFEDLLIFGYDYLACHQDTIKHYHWIQIDEVQDLNRMQLAIVDLVTAKDDYCVIYLGDEQQAIYSFMGAKLSTLNHLKEICRDNIHHFYGNYRSPQYLLNVFNRYAEVNLHVDKALLGYAMGKRANDAKDDGSLVLQSCEQSNGMNDIDHCMYDSAIERLSSYEDGRTAILTASNKVADLLSAKLEAKGIEHFKISGSDFLCSKDMKMVFAHLNIYAQPDNIMSWARILMGTGVMKSLDEANEFLRNANEAYLRGTDLISEQFKTLVKNFVRDYPREYVIFDTETTGLDVNNDDIVEIAALKIKDGCVVDELDIMLFTEKQIPPMLGDIVNPLPSIYAKREKLDRETGLLQFMDFIGEVPLLAHNAKFDSAILLANLSRYCEISLSEYMSFQLRVIHDSLALARILEPHLKSYKLKDLLETFGLQGVNSHLAIDDVKATKYLVDYLYSKASHVFVLQNEFFNKYSVLINQLKAQYGDVFMTTLKHLNSKNTEECLLSKEIESTYELFIEKGYIHEQQKIKYLLPYINGEIVPRNSELTLIEQIEQYMMTINTLREADLCDSTVLKEKVKVFVTTVHKSKGLEFDNVIVFDARDDVYPYYEVNQRLHNPDPSIHKKAQQEKEEDARKLYVAISRSKKRLCILYPRHSTGISKWGNWYSYDAKVSPFLNCISDYFEIVDE